MGEAEARNLLGIKDVQGKTIAKCESYEEVWDDIILITFTDGTFLRIHAQQGGTFEISRHPSG